MYKYSDLEDQIDYLKNALKFFRKNLKSYEKNTIDAYLIDLSSLETDLIYFISEYERKQKEKYIYQTRSDDYVYMTEAIS